jgi:hypothetical protein
MRVYLAIYHAKCHKSMPIFQLIIETHSKQQAEGI